MRQDAGSTLTAAPVSTRNLHAVQQSSLTCTVLAVNNVAWCMSMPDAAWGCSSMEFQLVIIRSDTEIELLIHKVTVLNVC